jgi:hypothetical protein
MNADLVAPDPTVLYRVRDGVYAPDLLIAAVVEFDVFTWLARRGSIPASRLGIELGMARLGNPVNRRDSVMMIL